ncbi:hypothetical protein BD779DRAFT_1659859 [Infundibulicybe gibba]|nr:hypothetical protein BD779DRAFT_1659859 [Infundibulicybe gibba]
MFANIDMFEQDSRADTTKVQDHAPITTLNRHPVHQLNMSESVEHHDSALSKLSTAKDKKEIADQAFKEGNAKDALKSYYEALLYLLGLDKNAMSSMGLASPTPAASGSNAEKQKTEVSITEMRVVLIIYSVMHSQVDEMIEKIYANMSACHMKLGNWKRAIETADKALAKNENNFKAMFRKGKALGELGFFEKSVKILEEVKTKNPSDANAVDSEVARLRVIDNEKEKAHKQKLKGFLSRDKGERSATPTKLSIV